ncbi:MAG: glycoside hydrolase family 43 protein [Spirosomataceae bacterium]
MRIILALWLLTLSPLCAQTKHYLFSYFKNNGQDGLHLAHSTDGLHWKSLKGDSSLLYPTVSKDKLMRDPCILRDPTNGLFRMVWTVSWNAKGIGYAESSDLVHWSEQRYIPVMEHEAEALNCWAPELIYDKAHKEYLIFWATTIPGRFAQGQEGGDGKYNHRMYCTRTKDFQTFSPTTLFYDPGFNVIDATIVQEKGQFFMILKDETKNPAQKNLKVATSPDLSKGFSAASTPFTRSWVEGPTLVKLGPNWTVYFDEYTRHKYGAMQTQDFKTWTDISEQIELPNGIRHGTIFEVSEKEFQRFLDALKH